MREKKIYLVFDENEYPAFCCSNEEILWQKISEKLFDGAKVRLSPNGLNNDIQVFSEYTNTWWETDAYYITLSYYECDE